MAVSHRDRHCRLQPLFALAKPELVATVLPALDVLMDEARVTDFFEFGSDGLVGEPVVEHGVYEGAEDVGQAGDFAVATAGRFYRSHQGAQSFITLRVRW